MNCRASFIPGEPCLTTLYTYRVPKNVLLPIVVVLGAGFLAAYLQHGFLPGADRAFPLAGAAVPIWHLVWMGLWTGYTMGQKLNLEVLSVAQLVNAAQQMRF